MLFGNEEDRGDFIRCYLIPDAGGTTPSVKLSSNNQVISVLKANKERPEIVRAGRHAIGSFFCALAGAEPASYLGRLGPLAAERG